MNEILEWIVKDPSAAFIAGGLVVVSLSIICDCTVRLVRSITGQDTGEEPCYCCRENGCSNLCRCNEAFYNAED